MEPFKFKFELTADDTNIIFMTLAKAPWEVVDGIISNMRGQIQPQMPAYQEYQEKNKAEQDAVQSNPQQET